MTNNGPQKITRIQKSTNVRSSPVAKGLQALQALDASLAASAMERLFLTAKRHSPPTRERDWMQGARRFDIKGGGRRLAAWTWGEGPTVLLAHGWAGRGSQLGAFVAPLVEQGFRVVTWDAPGHGASSGLMTSLPAIRDGVLALADSEGPIHGVIAHSAGSVGATLACHRGLDAGRLVYLSPVLDPGAFLPVATDALGLGREVATMARCRIERRVGERFATLSRLAASPIDDLPLLVVHDHLDREVPWQNGRRLADRWRGAKMISTTGLGHRRILRDKEVVEATLGFMTSALGCEDEEPQRLEVIGSGRGA